jgi:tRNA nucleotidyltransferase/poly(A) polymerase
MASRSLLPDLAVELTARLPGLPPLWLVGGAVRDAILGRTVVDLDFAVDGEARHVARRAADLLGAAYYELDDERDTGRVLLPPPGGPRTLDFARLRGAGIEADLRGRDFTIDAMAVALDSPGRVIDPTGGLQDLRDRVLRLASPGAIEADPLRALRAVRLAADLELRIDPAALSPIRAARDHLAAVSAERRRDEWMRMLQAPRPGRLLRLLDHLGLLTGVLPELEPLRGLEQPAPHAFRGLEHTLTVVDRLGDLLWALEPLPTEDRLGDLTLGEASLRLGRFRTAVNDDLRAEVAAGHTRRQLLFLAAALHDAGKAETGRTAEDGRLRFLGHEEHGADLAAACARRLRLSADEAEFLAGVVRHHMAPEWLQAEAAVTPRAAYRFFRRCGSAAVGVILLSLADLLGKYASPPPQAEWGRRVDVARSLLEAAFEQDGRTINPPRLLDGDDVMRALGLPPGPGIGELLETVREAQAAGAVTTREEALAFLRARRDGSATAEDNRD